MIFEFLIVYRRSEGTDIVDVIRDCLTDVLIENLNEFDDDAVERMITPRLERPGDDTTDDDGNRCRRMLFGFGLDLPEETASRRAVVDEFAEALSETEPVLHVVKFEDPVLQEYLAHRAVEVAALEMKLRRVLSLIYLHAYQDGDPYDLLHEESIKPMNTNKEPPTPAQMKKAAENQFFHLTFSQYVELNKRPKFNLDGLLELVRNQEAYDGLRAELDRNPVVDEDDVDLLAGLKAQMNSIEAMRNCCAHNRRPSEGVEANYKNARPVVDKLLDDYLARWQLVEEMFWVRAAREAVESAIARARWDKDERTITLFDADDDRPETVGSREELEEYLRGVANTEFYANAPRDDGEFLDECDDDSIVWTVLEEYEKQLDELFGSENRTDP